MNNRCLEERVKLTGLILGIAGLILSGLSACVSSSSPANTGTATPVKTVPVLTALHLDDNASQWGIFYDGGSGKAMLENVSAPSVDGSALKTSLLNGQPYTGIHAYHNLAPSDTATSFQMNLSFYFPSAVFIQALEFTMSTWVNNQRWEWALQWEHVGDGSPQQGNPPTWRIWTGNGWQNIGVIQQLSAGVWHKLQLKGDISNGQVLYVGFSCDDMTANLGQRFAPVSSTGDKLAVAVQLDGDKQEDPYQVYLDRVDFAWS